ncbi:MAG: FecR domain-containing protein [Akkermansiaceae bacterium]|nr:FecR domain-containing protein [Akkermansiaceae bacterium]
MADLLETGLFEQVGSELRRLDGDWPSRNKAPRRSTPPPPPPPRPRGPGPPPRPQASLLPPPSQPPRVPPVADASYHGPPAGFFGERREQPLLRSSQRRVPAVALTIVAVLLVGIAVALLFGLVGKPSGAEEEVVIGVIAKVDAAEGSVLLTRDIGQQEAERGMDLFQGDLINVEQGAARVAYLSEKTYLHIRSGSEIRMEDQKAGKRVRLTLGEVTVEAASQPVEKPMVILTANAIITLTGTNVTVRVVTKETLVEVSQGKVRVERRGDGSKVELGSGSWTMVSEAQPLTAWEFVGGVNLNGEEVEIDGRPWMSYTAAQGQGLKVEAIGKEPDLRSSRQPPAGYVPGVGVRSMLMSSVAAKGAKLAVKWPQPNGRYQVFVWIMEDSGNQARSLRLNLEEKLVGEGLGKEQILGQWNRFGPYPASVNDENLDLLVSADRKRENQDPHLAGISVYRVAGTGPAPPEAPATPVTPAEPAPPGEPGLPPAIQPTIP